MCWCKCCCTCCSSRVGTITLLGRHRSGTRCWSSLSAIFVLLRAGCRCLSGTIFCGRLNVESCSGIHGYLIFYHPRHLKLPSRFCLFCDRILSSGVLLRVLFQLGLAHRIRRYCFLLFSYCLTGSAICFWNWASQCLKTDSMHRFPFSVRPSPPYDCHHGNTRISWIPPIMIFPSWCIAFPCPARPTRKYNRIACIALSKICRKLRHTFWWTAVSD